MCEDQNYKSSQDIGRCHPYWNFKWKKHISLHSLQLPCSLTRLALTRRSYNFLSPITCILNKADSKFFFSENRFSVGSLCCILAKKSTGIYFKNIALYIMNISWINNQGDIATVQPQDISDWESIGLDNGTWWIHDNCSMSSMFAEGFWIRRKYQIKAK